MIYIFREIWIMQSEFNVIDLMTIELKENTVKRGEVINKVIKRKRIKVVLMLIIEESIIFFLWYYETIFYSIYSYDKTQWCKIVIFSFLFYISFLLFISTMSFLFKVIGIKFRSAFCYNIYLFIHYLNYK